MRPDFKDLKDVVEWLKAHDDEARKMAEASKAYMDREFGKVRSKQTKSSKASRPSIYHGHLFLDDSNCAAFFLDC